MDTLAPPSAPLALDQTALDTLFAQARTFSYWLDKPLPEGTPERLWDMVRMGPTSANSSPVRLIFVATPEGKQRLRPALSKGNTDKTMAAPLTVIVCHDRAFADQLPVLHPHVDARPWFADPAKAAETAFRNGSLQGAYLILAARALGLDAGPMSGFDVAKVTEEFLLGTTWEANFLVNIGYGDRARLHARLPRLAFDAACKVV